MAVIPDGKDAAALFHAADAGRDNLQVETAREYLAAEALTPTEVVFVCQHNPLPPNSFSDQPWAVKIGGVDPPRTVSLDEIRSFGALELTTVLQCAGNGRAYFTHTMMDGRGPNWQVGAAANVRWRGTPLRAVLDALGGPASVRARYLTATGGEPTRGLERRENEVVERSIPLSKAYRDGLLAWEMDGGALRPEHGGPLRLIVPGYYGVNNVKWLARLKVSELESQARIQRTSYRIRPVGQRGDPSQPTMWEMPVKSFTTRLRSASDPYTIELEGVAFSGGGAVVQVEVSFDGGRGWRDATFRDPIRGPYAWRRFHARADVGPGRHVVCTRASDDRGQTQPRNFPPNERGYGNNSWLDHAQEIDIDPTSVSGVAEGDA